MRPNDNGAVRSHGCPRSACLQFWVDKIALRTNEPYLRRRMAGRRRNEQRRASVRLTVHPYFSEIDKVSKLAAVQQFGIIVHTDEESSSAIAQDLGKGFLGRPEGLAPTVRLLFADPYPDDTRRETQIRDRGTDE